MIHLLISCRSVTQLCPTVCDPMNCSTPGLPVPHHFPMFVQVHVLWISDAIQPSHLLMLSSPALYLLQHQGLFQRVDCSHWWPKYWSFSFSISPSNEYSGLISLRLTSLIFLLSKGLSEFFSSTTVWRHQFFSALPSLQSSSHNCMWALGRL